MGHDRRPSPAVEAAVGLSDHGTSVREVVGRISRLLPTGAVVKVGIGALGDAARFSNPRQVYCSAGLNPIQYESAGKRPDTRISREGSVALRQALIDLGWVCGATNQPPPHVP